MSSRRKAFTLVELLAVIAIIGILAGFIFAAVGGAIGRARVSKTKSTITSLSVALKNYERDMGSFEAEVANEKMPTGPIPGDRSGDQKRIQIVRLLSGRELVKQGGTYIFKSDPEIRSDPNWQGPYHDWKPGELLPKTRDFRPGQVLDAWGNPLMIRIKIGSFDDRMKYRPDSFEIYSRGPNEKDDEGKGDDITNWD